MMSFLIPVRSPVSSTARRKRSLRSSLDHVVLIENHVRIDEARELLEQRIGESGFPRLNGRDDDRHPQRARHFREAKDIVLQLQRFN